MNDVLLPLARRYGVNLVTGLGEMSETSTRLFLERVAEAGVPGRIIYVSDFDPAGRSMPVAVSRKIEYAACQGLDVLLDPVVLTQEQCRSFELPRTPIKPTEKRAAKFEERFGAGATELDALEALHPGELARIVGAEIERYIDPNHQSNFNIAVGEHQAELARISDDIHDHYAEEIGALEAEYSELVAGFESFGERAGAVFDSI